MHCKKTAGQGSQDKKVRNDQKKVRNEEEKFPMEVAGVGQEGQCL